MSGWLKRHHYGRCARKARYKSAEVADRRAEHASRHTGELIISYKCFDCGKWHIGHADQTQIAARNLTSGSLTFCSICGRLIPADLIEQAKQEGRTLTTCSQRCERKMQQQPPPAGS
jgi:hypothetical protein